MAVFNSFVSKDQSPIGWVVNHQLADPTAMREALACLLGSEFQIGESLCLPSTVSGRTS